MDIPPRPRPALTEREVWVKAATLLAKHCDRAEDHIIAELGDLLAKGTDVEIEDWRRIATAIDNILSTRTQ